MLLLMKVRFEGKVVPDVDKTQGEVTRRYHGGNVTEKRVRYTMTPKVFSFWCMKLSSLTRAVFDVEYHY